MLRKIISIVMIICIVTCFVTTVSASGVLDSIFNQGNKLNGGSTSGIGNKISSFINNTLKPIIGLVGNLVFAAITVILGLKYIWSSAEGKADVQESLPTFVVAVVMFYLAGTVFNFATGATSSISGATNWASFSGNIMWIISTFVKYAALAGLVFIGIKYMMASAEGRASMKTSMGGMVIGLLFVFMASNVVNLFVNIAEDLI